jgi:molybdopterin converting factor small subunit
VGIGTTTPYAPLTVNGFVSTPNASYRGIRYADWQPNFGDMGVRPDYHNGVTSSSDRISIQSQYSMHIQNGVLLISSDKRIKDVIGRSGSKGDLSTLLSVEITDYKMKDKVVYGNQTAKKVIAQQLKSVYPQAVSLQTSVIPNIYKAAEIKEGYVALQTDLKKGDRVKLIFIEGEQELEEIVEVLDADQRGFTIENKKNGKVFVFGKQVDDFHVVDYDAVSMLNVSATQELYKLILKQQKTIDAQKAQISAQIEKSKKTQSNFDERLKNLEILFNISKLNE